MYDGDCRIIGLFFTAVYVAFVQVLPGLYVGDCRDARDVKQLEENKITDILAVFDLARPILAVTLNFRR